MALNRVDIHKRKLLKALKESKGIVVLACQKVKLSRTIYYNYINTDPEFAEQVNDIHEEAVDFVESKLFEKINGVTLDKEGLTYDLPPSDAAIIFFLKTRGKHRGYVDKTEITNTNLNINVEPTPEEAKRIKDAFDKDY